MDGYKTATEALIAKMESDHKAHLARIVAYAEKEHTFVCGELAKVVAERDELKSLCSSLYEALKELHALVIGECPSLLDEDSGGDARLCMEIEDALKKARGEQ